MKDIFQPFRVDIFRYCGIRLIGRSCCYSVACCHGILLFSCIDRDFFTAEFNQKYNLQLTGPSCRLMLVSSPGSHDSFSFYIDEASPVGPEQPETVQNFVSVFGTVAKKLMRKWLATQTMNFTCQLEAGIRFFDLRISTKPRDPDNELYFAHGLFSATVSRVAHSPHGF